MKKVKDHLNEQRYWDIFTISEDSDLFNAASLMNKNKIEAINSSDNEDYEKLYLQEFKKRKSENIISSGTLIGLATGLTMLLLFESFGGGMGGYDVCFDPQCG